MRDDVPDFLSRRDIDTDLELPALAALGLPLFPALAAFLEAVHRVYGDEAPFLHIGQHGAKGGEDLFGRMSALGQKRTFSHLRPMSALPPKADIGQRRDSGPLCRHLNATVTNPAQ